MASVLFIHFLIEQQTINADYYLKLQPSEVSISFKTARSISQKCICTLPLWQHEHCRIHLGRYCHSLPIVLTWCQAIFTFSVHWKRHPRRNVL